MRALNDKANESGRFRKLRPWIKGMTVSTVMIFGVAFLFQNCAQPLNLASSDSASFSSSLPFAFDTEMDTLAYMSCSGGDVGLPASAYFTFRLGAYGDDSGIKLSDAFAAQTGNFNASDRADAIAQSTENAGAVLQLSLRPYNNYSQIMTRGQSSSSEGFDYDDILAPLDSSTIDDELSIAGDQRIHYFSGLPGVDDKRLEGSVLFSASETLAEQVRSNLEDSFMLTLTYGDADGSDERVAKGPDGADLNKSVYGTGYRVTFSQGFAMTGGAPVSYAASLQRRALASVTEVNLQTGSPALSTWSCPDFTSSSSAIYTIVRPQDVGTSTGLGQVICDPSTEVPNNPDPAYQAVRRVLPFGSWGVDNVHKCVVPLNSADMCYGDRGTTGSSYPLAVNYTGSLGGSSACGTKVDGTPVTATLAGTTYQILCPHYVSICVRQ